jgi:hypothetical protein
MPPNDPKVCDNCGGSGGGKGWKCTFCNGTGRKR